MASTLRCLHSARIWRWAGVPLVSGEFYLATGRSDQALDVLRYCYRKNKGSLTGFEVYALQEERGSVDASLGILRSLLCRVLPPTDECLCSVLRTGALVPGTDEPGVIVRTGTHGLFRVGTDSTHEFYLNSYDRHRTHQ